MSQDVRRVSGVLADPTRYAIYRFVASRQDPASVGEVAERFALHPNVARMHLNRLRDIGLLSSGSEKSGRSGRPELVYLPAGEALNLCLPAREYRFLAEVLLEGISRAGPEAAKAAAGVAAARGAQASRGSTPEGPGDMRAVITALNRFGLDIEITRPEAAGDEGDTVVVTLRNCSFLELARAHPRLVCPVCRELVLGTLPEGLGPEKIEAHCALAVGGGKCYFRITGLTK